MCSSVHRLQKPPISTATRRIADQLLQDTRSNPPQIRRQLIDANQLQRLSLTLDRPCLYSDVSVTSQLGGPPIGTPVPPSYHVAYFTPALLPGDLGSDGADISYNPPAPFTRRMWTGGKLSWEKDNPLKVGDEATESTKLISSQAKRTREGEEMIVVGVHKTIENSRGLSLTDQRDWTFRLKLDPSKQGEKCTELEPNGGFHLPEASGEKMVSRDFLQTPVSLFRFSACTFNAHMIHYSWPWCRDMEDQPEIIIHGPLNLINMSDFWRDDQGRGGYAIPSSLRYRSTAPFYANRRYRGLLERGNGETYIRLWGSGGQGNALMGMMADIVD